MPLPVPDFIQILAILSDVLFVLNKLVVHLLNQIGTLVSKLGQMHNSVFYQIETVDLVLNTHIKRSGDGTFLLVSMNRHVVVVALESQLVDQGRISMECEDNRFVFCEDCIVL